MEAPLGMMRLIDTHCHLDLYPDALATISRVIDAGTYTIAVTNTPSVATALVRLVGSAPRIRVALGLHPELAVTRRTELPLFHELLPGFKYVGEVGLDYVAASDTQRRIQRKVFDEILSACDGACNKTLTIHSRRAADDVVDAVGGAFRGGWILHWYSGSRRTLARAISHGAYISVNTSMVLSRKGQELIAAVPVERVLTETDGPFVQVSPGIPASPENVVSIIEALARLWQLPNDETARQVFANFRVLLTSVGNRNQSGILSHRE